METLYSRSGNVFIQLVKRSFFVALTGLMLGGNAAGLELEAESFVSSSDGLTVAALAGETVVSGSSSPDSMASAALATYLVDFPSKGIYEVSARLAVGPSSTHTLFISVDGRWSIDPVHAAGCVIDGLLAWIGPVSADVGQCETAAGAIIAVDSPGPTVVSIASPDEAITLDRIHFQQPVDAVLVASLHELGDTPEGGEFTDLELVVAHAGASDTLAEGVSVSTVLGEAARYEGHEGCECELSSSSPNTLNCAIGDLWGGEDHACTVSVSGASGVTTLEVFPTSSSALRSYGSRTEVFLPVEVSETPDLSDLSLSDDEADAVLAASEVTSCVGNLVWLDTNGDGVKEEHESGFSNAEVRLVDFAGTVRQSTVASNGYYKLCDVPGEYFLEVSIPSGFEPTLRNASATDDYHDSDAGIDGRIQVTIVADRIVGRHDTGLVPVSDIDGVQEGVTTDASINDDEADQASDQPSSHPAGEDGGPDQALSTQDDGCVGNLVWNDTNRDGRKQSSERGMPNIDVELVYAFDGVVDSDVTSSTGYFLLCGPAGEAEVHVSAPQDFTFTKLRADGNEYHDSDADTSGVVRLVVEPGKKRDGYDIGLVSADLLNSAVTETVDVVPSEPVTTAPVASETDVDSLPGDDDVASQPVAERDGLLFGPWVERRHRNDGVFGRFDAALTVLVTSETVEVLEDARRSGTQLFVQLGSPREWGWNFSNNTSTFTLGKWKRSVSGFGDDPRLRQAIAAAISDGTIRGIYLIDEPHHTRWSPSGRSYTHIPNADIDEMARHVKTYWPNVSTSVRASARTLFAYSRDVIDWKYLDEAFLMINYRKWSRSGLNRTIEGFMERELKAYKEQGLGMIGSIQMLIGAPTSNKQWWGAGERPSGKLKTSPREIAAYFEAFTAKRNASGKRDASGEPWTDAVMVFRWDRNKETDWTDSAYDEIMSDLIQRAR